MASSEPILFSHVPRAISPISRHLHFTKHSQHVTHTHLGSSINPDTLYYLSFKNPNSLGELLNELNRKDSELSNLLRTRQARHVPKLVDQGFEGVLGKKALVSAYQDFVGSLISLIVQSVFLENPEKLDAGVNDARAVVRHLSQKNCPVVDIFRRLVVDPITVASTCPEDASPKEIRGIPTNQLARFCDVSILRFLSRANEQTSPRSILWAIDYIINLLSSLDQSLSMHSTAGWYGAPSTRKKKKVTSGRPPPFPIPSHVPPTVVIVSSPSLSNVLDPVTGQPSIKEEVSPLHFQFPGSDNDGTSPQQSPGTLTSRNMRAPNADSNRFGLPPSTLLLQRSPELARTVSPTNTLSPASSSSSPINVPVSRREEWMEENDAMRSGNLIPPGGHSPRSPRLAEMRTGTPQSIPEEDEEGGEERGAEGGEEGTWRGENGSYGSFDSARGRGEEEGEGEEVKLKELDSSADSVPNVDLKKELETLCNAEGRISLVAILQAISNLPQSADIWTERLGNKCFTLIQYCMDLGLTQASRGDESVSTRRRKFQRQENVAFHTHDHEHPSRLHSRYIVHYATYALIHCAVNLMVGCTHESESTCILFHRRLITQKDATHSKLLRHLKRIHLHSPQDFHQVMMNFASVSTFRKIFQFLHIVLQYCHKPPADNVDTLMLSIVSSVLRVVVDRLTQLDLLKPSLQNVSE